MENEKTRTEREYVLAQREAFERGIVEAHEHMNACISDRRDAEVLYRWEEDWGKPCIVLNDVDVKLLAKRAYPLPKVTRPRVVADPEYGEFEWSVVRGELHVRNPKSESATEWGIANGHDFGAFEPTRRRVQVWADLLSSPLEEVEE